MTLIITNMLLLSSLVPNEQMKIHHKGELINWLKNKVCHQLSDSYRELKYSKKTFDWRANLYRQAAQVELTALTDQISEVRLRTRSISRISVNFRQLTTACRACGDLLSVLPLEPNEPKEIYWLENKIGHHENDSCGALVDAHFRQINWLKNKMCRHTNDSYRLPGIHVDSNAQCTRINSRSKLRNNKLNIKQIMYITLIIFIMIILSLSLLLLAPIETSKEMHCHNELINWLKNKMCRQVNDSYSTLKNTGEGSFPRCKLTASGGRMLTNKQTSTPAFSPRQAARVEITASESRRTINLLYIFINFRPSSRKNRQSFFDWRTKQKPSRRAGLVITAVKDSPGLIGGRLEPQRGRSLTVKAVCDGTLGWKDPPFNSILALPGATHQDPTQNEIINDLNSLKTKYIIISKNLNQKKKPKYYRNISLTVARQSTVSGIINRNYNTTLIHLCYSRPARTSQDTRRINCLKIKMCRQLDDSCHPPKINSFKYTIRHKYESYYTAGKIKLIIHNLNDLISLIISNSKIHYILPIIISNGMVDYKNRLCGQDTRKRKLRCQINTCIFWHKNKMCRQIFDNYHPAEKWQLTDNYIGNDNYSQCIQINWHKNKMCRQTNYPTLNEIIKNIITKITINQHNINLYEYRNLKVIMRTLPTTNGNDLINTNTNKLASTTSPSTKTEQVALQRKLSCQKKNCLRIKCAVELMTFVNFP